jgi:hypothetical protein
MDSDKLPDRGFQFLNATLRATLNLPLCESCKPTLHLVEQGGMGRGEVQKASLEIHATLGSLDNPARSLSDIDN